MTQKKNLKISKSNSNGENNSIHSISYIGQKPKQNNFFYISSSNTNKNNSNQISYIANSNNKKNNKKVFSYVTSSKTNNISYNAPDNKNISESKILLVLFKIKRKKQKILK